MLTFLKKIPLALSGLVLGTTALAGLVGPVWPAVQPWVLGLAASLFLLLILRLLVTGRNLRQEFASPVVASCFAASLMAAALLSSSLPLPKGLGFAFWLTGLIVYLLYILAFTVRFAGRRRLDLVYPSWAIVYVGIAAAAVAAVSFEALTIGWWLLGLAALNYILLMPVIFYRLFKQGIDEQLRPLLAILAAPTSLLLVTYLRLAEEPNALLTGSVAVLAQLLYLAVLTLVPGVIAKGFSPLHAALTFPLVNTAIGLRLTLNKLGISHPLLDGLAALELLIGVAAVTYVLIGYLGLLPVFAKAGKTTASQEKADKSSLA